MRFSDFIKNNQKEITTEWVKYAQDNIEDIKTLQLEEVEDHIHDMLTRIVKNMETYDTDAEQEKKSKGNEDMEQEETKAANSHGKQRVDVGFDLVELSSEFRALRASVLRLWEEKRKSEKLETDFQDLIRFNEAIDELWMVSLKQFQRTVEDSRNWFMGILAHDLRNPLSAISGVQSFLEPSTNLSEKEQFLLRSMGSNVKNMKELIDNLLELTNLRLGSGMNINKSTVDLTKESEKIVQQVRSGYPEADLVLESSGPIQGEWDGKRLDQMMTNLITNALKHGRPGSHITVSAYAKGNEAFFKVHNEGSPIPDRIKKMISSGWFAKTDGDPTKKDSHGLGLYIVKAIVDGHNGQLKVESSEKEGTTFKVILPKFN